MHHMAADADTANTLARYTKTQTPTKTQHCCHGGCENLIKQIIPTTTLK